MAEDSLEEQLTLKVGMIQMSEILKREEVIKMNIEQKLSEIPALGRHVVGAYYQGLKDAGIISYGEEYKAITMVMKRFGIRRDQVNIRDNEGHPNMYISNEANEKIEQQLKKRDSHSRERYRDFVPAGMWQAQLRW